MKTLFATFLLLTLSYIALIELWQPPINVWEDQENANYVRAERLLHGDQQPWGVIVGSSLVAEMRYFLDDEELFVLSQQGGSAREGLEVLVQAGMYPEVVFIELNALTVAHRPDFADSVTKGFRPFMASRFKAFQLEYRPINVIINLARDTLGQGGPPPGAPRGDPWGELPQSHFDPENEAFQVRLEELKAAYTHDADSANYLQNLRTVCASIEQLAANGVHIVLLDLPVHPDLLHTAYHQTRRELAREILTGDYEWLDLAAMPDMIHPDGIHITLVNTRDIVSRLLNFKQSER